MVWLLVFLPGLLAGLVQGLTGFGAAIVMMIFLPQLFPIAQSAAVAGVIMAASVITLVWRYHQHIHFRQIIVPFIVYASVAAYSVHLGQVLDVQLLRRLLGALLVSLAGYFSLSKRAANQTYPWWLAGLFMIISGFFNGLFGIGGPLMALYFLSLADTTADYLGNLQTFFDRRGLYFDSSRIERYFDAGLASPYYDWYGRCGHWDGAGGANPAAATHDDSPAFDLLVHWT